MVRQKVLELIFPKTVQLEIHPGIHASILNSQISPSRTFRSKSWIRYSSSVSSTLMPNGDISYLFSSMRSSMFRTLFIHFLLSIFPHIHIFYPLVAKFLSHFNNSAVVPGFMAPHRQFGENNLCYSISHPDFVGGSIKFRNTCQHWESWALFSCLRTNCTAYSTKQSSS